MLTKNEHTSCFHYLVTPLIVCVRHQITVGCHVKKIERKAAAHRVRVGI